MLRTEIIRGKQRVDRHTQTPGGNVCCNQYGGLATPELCGVKANGNMTKDERSPKIKNRLIRVSTEAIEGLAKGR